MWQQIALGLFLLLVTTLLHALSTVVAVHGLMRGLTARVWRDSVAQVRITNIADRWVRQYPTDLVVRSVLVSGRTAKIVMTGPEQPSTIDDLGAEIKSCHLRAAVPARA